MKSMQKELSSHPALPASAALALCLALVAGVVSAQDTPAAKSETEAATPAAGALKTEKEKLSYALGLNVGLNAQKQMKKGSLEVDTVVFIQAINDALSENKPLLTIEEANAILASKRTEMRAEQEQARKALADKNQKEEKTFLAKNKTEEGIITLENGLQYKVLKAGDGSKPKTDDIARCEYRGTLLDGTEIDSTAKRGAPANLPLKQLIQGWREALELMPAGSKWQVFIPSKLAYGEHGGGPIGPNATLIFEVELLGINDAAPKAEAITGPANTDEDSAGKTAVRKDSENAPATVPPSDAAQAHVAQ